MSFCKNLSSHQDIYALFLNVSQHAQPGIFPARTVAIYTHDSGIWKMLGQRCLDPLCAMAERSNVLIPAFGANVWKSLLMSAVVTAQFLIAQMHYQPARAAVANRRPPA